MNDIVDGAPSAMTTAKDEADALTLTLAVFYDPNIFHYVSSGWDLDELLSQRICTLTSTLIQASISLRPAGAENSAAAYVMRASQLRREALRALFLDGGFGRDEADESDYGEGAHDEGGVTVDSSLAAALDRWMPLTHLHVHGGQRPNAAKRDGNRGAAPSVLVIDDEATDDEMDLRRLLSPAQPPQTNGSTSTTSPPPRRRRTATRTQLPLLVPAGPHPSVTLVLSLVKDSRTWRKMRHDARCASPLRPDGAHARALGANPPATDVDRGTETEAPQQQPLSYSSADVPSELFVSADDALFSQWLESTRAVRRRWRRQWQQQHCSEEATVAAIPSAPLSDRYGAERAGNVCAVLLLNSSRKTAPGRSSSSSTSSSEDDDGAPHSDEPAKRGQNDCGGARAPGDADARRAAILSAIERRQRK
ncbi:hypothetical protein ABB37_08808 [Leptomonas pyrrhocoris]|uniref:Uncharacterized protein n=1 Tax=Leptomonas pyrrhocoris TaxID=157538 RepID=A0A0M9FSH2_LEPPY|nr:hypothetical protein ABB37_08808 [Leptomonas pyrrhocoris]KPA75145.1 hypothetical protein ABB37_08808 [Leptomonas pyrrhocoris]|eukprot:XP_015653584.1 hypothetical protein ABB37_08808 [Leptomonas pyrrhocoris]